MEETWKDIEGYEGLYQVSDLGRIKSLDRYLPNGINSIALYKGKVKATHLNKDYECITLYKNKTMSNKKVHRLVAIAFIENPDNLPEVNHLDEIKTNNKKTNLQWSDRLSNVRHGTSIERARQSKINGKTSKKVYQYDLEGNFLKEYLSLAQAVRENSKLNISAISKCCLGKIKSHKNFIWTYKVKNYE